MAYVQLVGTPVEAAKAQLTSGRYYEVRRGEDYANMGGCYIRLDNGLEGYILTANEGASCAYLTRGSRWVPVARKPRGRNAVVQMLEGDLIPNGEGAPAVPEVISRSAPVMKETPAMSRRQADALRLFQNMYDAAKHYRATGEAPKLSTAYGICNNIENFYEDSMSITENEAERIKDNLIRAVPSYSGEYHYPVRSDVEGRSAEWAWDRTSNRWDDQYGANRLEQLGELCEAIRNRWDEKLTQRMTPAQQYGLSVGDVVMHEDGRMLELTQDDDSANPAFREVGTTGAGVWTHLSTIRRIDGASIKGLENGSVAEYVKAMDDVDAEIADLERQMAEIKRKLAAKTTNLQLLRRQLATKHGVKRVKD